MASNISLGNVTKETPQLCFGIQFFVSYFTVAKWIDVSTIVIGTAINTWLIAAILSSKDLRSRMRNKMLIGMCFQHLFEVLIYLPLQLKVNDGYKILYQCHFAKAYILVFYSNEFVSNWNFVMILAFAVYTAHGSEVFSKMTGYKRVIGSYGVLLAPWLSSFIFMLPIVFGFQFASISKNPSGVCKGDQARTRPIILTLTVGIPVTLVVMLFAALVFLKRRRQAMEKQDEDMSQQLIDESSEADPLAPFVAFVLIVVLCDIWILNMFQVVDIYKDCAK